jgi:hypothetical protein
MVLKWEAGAGTRIGWRTTLAIGGIGVLLAAYQVQGWKMPKPLAISLIVLLIVMIALLVSTIVFETVLAFGRFLEHRATSPSWVASTEPGVLDFEPDGIRANKRLMRELRKLSRDTQRLGTKTNKHASRMNKSVGKSGRTKQRRANRAARDIDRGASFIEKRLSLLEAIAQDISRNTDGLIATLVVETQEDIDALEAFRQVLEESYQTTEGAAQATDGYSRSVRDLEQQNPARTLRIACRRLGSALEGVVKTLRRVENGMRKATQALDRKIKEGEKQLKQPLVSRMSKRRPQQA